MRLQLNKKEIKTLSKSKKILSKELTDKVGGALAENWTDPAWKCMSYLGCVSDRPYC
ncbi:hypothetical protein [Pseudoalteromonas citrea]|uniref:hypothetical protein n=1 Tax=Pseudoalteromonas citrea TaxID=43655 RepID=UPI0014860A92|nr:hypothetical protein [Pseudoalteromonas citrea]